MKSPISQRIKVHFLNFPTAAPTLRCSQYFASTLPPQDAWQSNQKNGDGGNCYDGDNQNQTNIWHLAGKAHGKGLNKGVQASDSLEYVMHKLSICA